jgi:hypothetical protein
MYFCGGQRRKCIVCLARVGGKSVAKTYLLFLGERFCHSAAGMFLRSTTRKKDGKEHRYFSVVENRRLNSGKTAQRTVLYLGEVNDGQERA